MYNKTLIGDYVTLYGICIGVGILVCILMLRYLGRKLKLNAKFMDFVELTGYIVILIGFFTAALFQAIYVYRETGHFDLFGSGITFLGGLLGGAGSFIIIYVIMRKKLSGRIIDILPFAPCCITIAHAFGRVGCFFAGCCYGIKAEETDALYFLATKFPNLGIRYPVQLFEAIFLFILCGVMVYLVLKKGFKYNFCVYLVAYGAWRFFIEFYRDDDRGAFIGSISPSQFWSILMVVLAIPLYFVLNYLNKKREEELALQAEKNE